MIVGIIHDPKVTKPSSVGQYHSAHLYTPTTLPCDIDTDCRTLTGFTILVLVDHLPNVKVAIPYSIYKTYGNKTDELSFTGSFIFSSSMEYTRQVTSEYYRPLPILDKIIK